MLSLTTRMLVLAAIVLALAFAPPPLDKAAGSRAWSMTVG